MSRSTRHEKKEQTSVSHARASETTPQEHISSSLSPCFYTPGLWPVSFITNSRVEVSQGGSNPNIAVTKDQIHVIILSKSTTALYELYILVKNNPSSHHTFQISNNFIRRIGCSNRLDLAGMPSATELLGKVLSVFSSGNFYPWVESPLSAGSSSQHQSREQAASTSGSSSRTTRIQNIIKRGPDYTVSKEYYKYQQ
ncbi:hypothetical protein ASPSYDRAFT_27336 [Aspergillus sydowii CBS 593.65]|uniref:Uncharacterized protein n=1 Tax=Aspergillus sydowii CBS 593.65 TaxID=1036612 RepID=A0A1L9U158_9EURO|nr:uncharacterized protein ASPSYDRAFT_27336 [Aspergillus sydowii CBS 593.65]OJJ65395.1 hypothetical protein ASPSYDRAFT_27336 [Aspergillus sydowii CBS 593.65]